jgi:hypothetical protein
MKDDSKKSRAEEIIRMIRAKKAVEDISIRDIANAMRDQEKEEEDETKTQQMLEDMFPVEDKDQHSITAGPSIGRTSKGPFHEFEMMDISVNSMGLHRSIMEEIEFENDPKVLKAFFAERLGQVLEAVPDFLAHTIDFNIKGLK